MRRRRIKPPESSDEESEGKKKKKADEEKLEALFTLPDSKIAKKLGKKEVTLLNTDPLKLLNHYTDSDDCED